MTKKPHNNFLTNFIIDHLHIAKNFGEGGGVLKSPHFVSPWDHFITLRPSRHIKHNYIFTRQTLSIKYAQLHSTAVPVYLQNQNRRGQVHYRGTAALAKKWPLPLLLSYQRPWACDNTQVKLDDYLIILFENTGWFCLWPTIEISQLKIINKSLSVALALIFSRNSFSWNNNFKIFTFGYHISVWRPTLIIVVLNIHFCI